MEMLLSSQVGSLALPPPAERQRGANGCRYAPAPRASAVGDTSLSLSPHSLSV